MNVLCIMSDTFRRDHLAAYGDPAPWQRPGHAGEPFIHTPHLDRLAAQSAVFDRFYIGSYPTVPCRYDCFSGRYGFPTRGWQPLEPDDVILSELVAAGGHTPMLIFDPPMLITDAYNYTRGFAGWDFVRGQHADRYVVDPLPVTLPAAPYKIKGGTAAYLRNTAFRRAEGDWMCAQTLDRAADWLERNRTRDDFALWVDIWDPHEPFDAPDYDLARYTDPAYTGDHPIYPRYGRADALTDAERNDVRAHYAALVTLTDRRIGRLLDTLEATGLHRNTLVVFLSDHGHLFGDHGLQGKPTGPLGTLYEVTTRVPLLIRHPEGVGAGTRVGGIAQHPDLLPTVLEYLGLPVPDGVHGKSLWPLIRGEAADVRDFAVSGRFSRDVSQLVGGAWRASDAAAFDGAAGAGGAGEPLTLTTRRWAYLCPPMGGGDRELYDLDADPRQTENVLDRHPDVVAALHRDLVAWLREHGAEAGRVAAYERHVAPAPRTPLLPESIPLHAALDARGQRFAFTARGEAERGFAPGSVRETTLAALRRDHPDALVHIHDQYYRADDLL